MRFSFLPAGAKTPRRFECVERAIAGPQPIFFALRYGRPGYLKLLTFHAGRRSGAAPTMAARWARFTLCWRPLRETDLRVRMQEYMPVGLEFGIIYQN